MTALRITIEDYRRQPPVTHVMEFDLPDGRCKQYDVTVDGKPWRRMGLARALAGIRKALHPTNRRQR
jgi:hypothetical protein